MASRYKLTHHPLAAADYREAFDFFSGVDADLAALFRDDFKTALRAVASGHPAGTVYATDSSIRWIKLERFSHKVFFTSEADNVRFVLALVSGRRHPARIKRILSRRSQS